MDRLGFDEDHSINLAHGKAQFNSDLKKLRIFEGEGDVSDDDGEGEGHMFFAHQWFNGRKKSMLADFVAGTIDQLLLMALKQKHVMLRHLGLAGKVVIIDECHAYDAYMSQYLKMALSWLGAYGAPVVVLSATLPSDKRRELIGAYLGDDGISGDWAKSRAYPLITYTDGTAVRYMEVADTDKKSRVVAISRLATEDIADMLENMLSDGGYAGVIMDTVGRASQQYHQSTGETRATLPQGSMAYNATNGGNQTVARESDVAIVPLKPGNAGGGKGGTQVGPVQGTHLLYAGIGEEMATKLDRIEEMSAKDPKMVFTSLYHLINEDLLRECHRQMDGKKATGVDSVTKAEYEANLDENLGDLLERLKRKSYKPQPSLRVYIPKANGKMRPIGMAAYEDKLVQSALGKVLMAVYEPKFHNSVYGFRPKRGQHDALKELARLVEKGKTNYIVDADIKGFFNAIDHERVMELIKFRIADPNVLWLVKKTLTAGVVENGKWQPTNIGTEQGNLASPIIANIYMNYALALWHEVKFKDTLKGESGLVIFADDFVATFQYKEDATRFLEAVKARFALFGLELEPDKTRLVEFGRCAEENRRRRGEGKPETFDFLGFTHYCSKSIKNGRFRMKRRTAQKKYRTKLKEMNAWIKQNRHLRIKDLTSMLNVKLRGHFQYYGVTDNYESMESFKFETQKMLFKWLNRRSQKRSYTWEGFNELMRMFPLVRPKIYFSVYG
jgi:group II intron reverse transcriptase/maturase